MMPSLTRGGESIPTVSTVVTTGDNLADELSARLQKLQTQSEHAGIYKLSDKENQDIGGPIISPPKSSSVPALSIKMPPKIGPKGLLLELDELTPPGVSPAKVDLLSSPNGKGLIPDVTLTDFYDCYYDGALEEERTHTHNHPSQEPHQADNTRQPSLEPSQDHGLAIRRPSTSRSHSGPSVGMSSEEVEVELQTIRVKVRIDYAE